MFRTGSPHALPLLFVALITAPIALDAQIFRGYYSDGALKFESHEDRRRRIIRGYYPDGTLQFVASYKDGELDGSVKEYYSNGVLKAEVKYDDNRRDGIARFYYESGMLMGKIYYKRGRETGKAKFYDEKGRLTARGFSGDKPRRGRPDTARIIRDLEAESDSVAAKESE
ncbi:MAG: hypothetical protein GF344_05255 [Chitinivibrionales bacterium]|nr:hypothetical protein [Chitinivibrionales bacterium]MBD3356402.1 hypothetical protein [Chitinivibrionales bacterium]